ncbi:MAG: Ribosomal RNA large subunit methyltransferase K [Turneriella sp.]|nr:Ribosomal RNA large subunit methyltransferase K [Turneriella sp.]
MPLEELTNRLTRMQKHWSKWARRRSITCYRVYDRDIPEFPFTADIYEDHLILTEVDTPAFTQKPNVEKLRGEIQTVFCNIFGIAPQKLHTKTRIKQKHGTQYKKLSDGERIVVHENGLLFYVYPDNWLDTGLFLDHRNLRDKVRKESLDKKVLNLFCYTGAFSIYAAAGGASLVHSVDLSQRYLKILDDNWLLNTNSIKPQTTHENFAVDARIFLEGAASHFYDIIVCDSPVFSRSHKQERDFDVLRDHPSLIREALRTLKTDGVLYFSTNFRKFRIRFPEEGDSVLAKDISTKTIPDDFRNKRIHACYEIKKNSYADFTAARALS